MRWLLMCLVFFFVAPAGAGYLPDISIYDSKVDNKTVWILVDDCAVKIDKSKIKDTSYVIDEIERFCNLKIEKKAK